MKKILLLLLIFFLSSSSLAKIGDTYSCQMMSHLSSERELVKFQKKELEAFTFKRTKDYILITPFIDPGFASGIFQTRSVIFNSEAFHADGMDVYFNYYNGYSEEDIKEHGWLNFVHMHYPAGVTSVTALCKIID
jgi:hypothetical protein